MKHLFLALIVLGLAQSCKQKTQIDAVTAKKDPYKNFVFDAKKDLVCGMPTSAGVSDTLHYNDKVYGFCSKECKDEFVKNPTSYLKAK